MKICLYLKVIAIREWDFEFFSAFVNFRFFNSSNQIVFKFSIKLHLVALNIS